MMILPPVFWSICRRQYFYTQFIYAYYVLWCYVHIISDKHHLVKRFLFFAFLVLFWFLSGFAFCVLCRCFFRLLFKHPPKKGRHVGISRILTKQNVCSRISDMITSLIIYQPDDWGCIDWTNEIGYFQSFYYICIILNVHRVVLESSNGEETRRTVKSTI
jgi:hypothetical protein